MIITGMRNNIIGYWSWPAIYPLEKFNWSVVFLCKKKLSPEIYRVKKSGTRKIFPLKYECRKRKNRDFAVFHSNRVGIKCSGTRWSARTFTDSPIKRGDIEHRLLFSLSFCEWRSSQKLCVTQIHVCWLSRDFSSNRLVCWTTWKYWKYYPWAVPSLSPHSTIFKNTLCFLERGPKWPNCRRK